MRFLIRDRDRDRDGEYPALFDQVLAGVGIRVVLSGVRMPRMNSIMEGWIQACRHEFLDHFEAFFNGHGPHHALHGAAPLRSRPDPVVDPARLDHLGIHRRDRLGGVFHEYAHAA